MNNCVETKWDNIKKKQVCVHCGNSELRSVYIVTGHDHTDSSVKICNCGKGKMFEHYYEMNGYAREPLSYYSEYL